MKDDVVMRLLRQVKSGEVSVEDARLALEDASLTEESFAAAVDHGVFNEVKPGTAKPQMQTSAWIRPAIQGEERDDDTFRIEAEQPLLVYFFGVKSDSCSSCGLWMQEISRIHDIWSSRGLQVVGISKEGTADLERFLGET